MFARPLAPFRMRPLRRLSVRKITGPRLLAEQAEPPAISIKGSRSPLKVHSRLEKISLRVLKEARKTAEIGD